MRFIFGEDELINIANNHPPLHLETCMKNDCVLQWGRYGPPATLFEAITKLKPMCMLAPGEAEAHGISREAFFYHMKDLPALRRCETELARIFFFVTGRT